MLQNRSRIDKSEIEKVKENITENFRLIEKEFELDLTEDIVTELYALLKGCNWKEIKLRMNWEKMLDLIKTKKQYQELFAKFLIVISIFISCRTNVDLEQESTKEYVEYVADIIKLTNDIKESYCLFIEEFTKIEEQEEENLDDIIADMTQLVKEYVIHIGNINSYQSGTAKPSLAKACLLASSYTAVDSMLDVATVLNSSVAIGASFGVSVALGSTIPTKIAVTAGTNVFSFISNKLFGHSKSSLFSMTVAAASVGSAVIGSYEQYRPTIFGVIDSLLDQLPLKIKIPNSIKPWLSEIPKTVEVMYDTSSFSGRILNSARSVVQGAIDYVTGSAVDVAKIAQKKEYDLMFQSTSAVVKPLFNIYVIGILLVLYIFLIFSRLSSHWKESRAKTMVYEIEEKYKKQSKLLEKLPSYEEMISKIEQSKPVEIMEVVEDEEGPKEMVMRKRSREKDTLKRENQKKLKEITKDFGTRKSKRKSPKKSSKRKSPKKLSKRKSPRRTYYY